MPEYSKPQDGNRSRPRFCRSRLNSSALSPAASEDTPDIAASDRALFSLNVVILLTLAFVIGTLYATHREPTHDNFQFNVTGRQIDV